MSKQGVKVRGILGSIVAACAALRDEVKGAREGLTQSAASAVDSVIEIVDRAERLAAAFRRFPLFDLSVLSRLQPFKIKVRRGSQKAEIEMVLPTFGYGHLSVVGAHVAGPDRIHYEFHEHASYPMVMGHGAGTMLHWNGDILEDNCAAIQSLGGVGRVAFTTECPQMPQDVRRRVMDAQSEFRFDSLAALWEAEYQMSVPKDPLIIGHIGGVAFLIDQYDPSKMERYITSEFAQAPLEAEEGGIE